MRILLDECVPAQLVKLLIVHDCRTVTQCGWSGIQNGKLLQLAHQEFDCFLTSDQNVAYQQNLKNFDISILQLSTNNLRRIEAGITQIESALAQMKPGEFLPLSIP